MKNYQKERTTYGRFMYSLTIKWGQWLDNHIWLWYILNLTWGLPMTIVGLIIALSLLISGHKQKRFIHVLEFDFGNNWGGLGASFFIFIANNMGISYTNKTRCHELGHSYQNALFGPFTIFLISIPSVIRYWRDIFYSSKKKSCPDYDLIWFEGSATDLGLSILEINQRPLVK